MSDDATSDRDTETPPTMDYAAWFSRITGHPAPRPWQTRLAQEPACDDRMIRIPTGLGKTEGVLLAWAWHRLVRGDDRWPRRLVWCLPMRVLVEQTRAVADRVLRRAVAEAGLAEDACSVDVLMGGVDGGEWHLHPERPAVLVGTQDMLLSRALNRGYAASRARWPMDYGLLNHDALWVMDEVQLMGVGLATSVQLQAFRRKQPTALRPTHTWWMSATLQPAWLETADSREWIPEVADRVHRVDAGSRAGPVWEAEKPCTVHTVAAANDPRFDDLAALVVDAHERADPDGRGRVTLVIVNRVESARLAHGAIGKRLGQDPATDLRLVHSRFRGLEREAWPDEFLSRSACEDPATDRIIVATQVVEAGVDISATALVTELAPWASLVQRVGRAARYGGRAEVHVIDRALEGKKALPYAPEELAATREALGRLDDASIASLERLENDLGESDEALLRRLYPYERLHLLTERESVELFDTSPDLAGADLDVSRFIRSGDDRSLSVCWLEPPTQGPPSPDFHPRRDELCPVPVYEARGWLFDRSGRLKKDARSWSWDYVDGLWKPLRADECRPGTIVAVDVAFGGYSTELGFTGAAPRRSDPPIPLPQPAALDPEEIASQAQSRDDLSVEEAWKTIATHGLECGRAATMIGRELDLAADLLGLVDLAGRCHDLGKAHPAFDACTRGRHDQRPDRPDLAKAPASAWAPTHALYLDDRHGHRRGFRHELASALALFETLRSVAPDHEALLGPHRDLVQPGVLEPPNDAPPAPRAAGIAAELTRLSPSSFDLLVHLVSAHHGKVRGAWQGTPHDQDFPQWSPGLVGTGQPINGVRDGDALPSVPLFDHVGDLVDTPAITLHLDPAAMGLSPRYGASWSERLQRLLRDTGPFALAYLEALLRAADVRASRLETRDPLLAEEGATV